MTTPQKRFLFIAFPYAGTGANMLRYRSLANYLVSKGHRVDVIGFYKLEDKLENGVCYCQIKKKFSFSVLFWGLRLFMAHLYLLCNINLSRYLNRTGLAAITLVHANKLIKGNNYESCLVSIAPWAYYMIVDHIRKYTKVVVDICDPLYKNAITPASDSLASFRLEKRALHAADCVITVNEPSISIMTEEMGIDPKKIHFITPAMHVDNYYCGLKSHYRFNIPIKFIYSGSLYEGYRDLNEIIPVIESLPCLSLDVYTGSPCKPKSSNRIVVHDLISHDKLLALYKQFDILLFVDNFYGVQVPSKIFELIAQNKPILFVYDKRNMYLYNLLKGQEGILFVENNRDSIYNAISGIVTSREMHVHYTLDLSYYSESSVNKQLYSCLYHNNLR